MHLGAVCPEPHQVQPLNLLVFFFFKWMNLFIFGHAGSLLPCTGSRVLGVSVAVVRGLTGGSLRTLELRLSSCDSRASLPLGKWDLPRPRSHPGSCGIEPISPALAVGFLATGPPGKSQLVSFIFLLNRNHLFFSRSSNTTPLLRVCSLSCVWLFVTSWTVAC